VGEVTKNTKAEQVWSRPLEVLATEMQGGEPLDTAKDAFYRDVKLRLEKSKSNFAIRYEFNGSKEADFYRQYVCRRMRRDYDKGFVRSKLKCKDGLCYVYFCRGSNYRIVADG